MIESLNKKEWEDFCLDDLFKITSTSSGIDKCRLINLGGDIPYITRTDKNNGYELYVGIQDSKYKIDRDNVITIGLDTQTVFYQQHLFYTGQNIQILQSQHLNKYTALFIIPMIKILMQKFNWGSNGATLTRLRRSRILLPVNKKGEPDYKFMEKFIKEREEKLQQRYKKDVTKRVDNLQQNLDRNKDWGEFKIKDIFPNMVAGKSKGLNHLEQVHSNGIPYLGATNRNNGVLCFVKEDGNEELIQQGNCIAFIRNGEGSMGYSIYKAENFIATSDITLGYNNKINKYSGMFITTIADRVRGKYSFNYKRSDTRLKKEILSLPINSKGEPDYQYMEDYMKYLEQKKLLKYLDYIK